MQFHHRRYLAFAPATRLPRVLLDAVHAASPGADAYTGTIAEAVAQRSGCHCIIGTVSRQVADLNRPPGTQNAAAIDEYRRTIGELLAGAGLLDDDGRLIQPFLHLALHGMGDGYGSDIELGTCHGMSCAPEVRARIVQRTFTWAAAFDACRPPRIALDLRFSGDSSKVFHRQGDPVSSYPGYGAHFHTIQIEIAHWLREDYRDKVIGLLCDLVTEA